MRVLVAGLGKSGWSAIDLLRSRGAIPIACDSRPAHEIPGARERILAANVEFRTQSAGAFQGVDLVVLSPGVPVEAVEGAAVPVIGELELASHFLMGPSIGITGSNGKTTTTSLVGHMLAHAGVPCQVGGNIGTPPTAMIATSRADQYNVLELSSFQLETASNFRAKIGVCLNVTPNHLDRHGTFERYAAAKERLFRTQSAEDFAVLNADDATCVGFAATAKAQAVWFCASHDVSPGVWLGSGQLRYEGGVLMEADEIPLRGSHNVENVMAAAAACLLAGAAPAKIREAVATFRPVEHRLELVRTVNGVEYFNDSKATSTDAAMKAIDAFPGRLWIILGGKAKEKDYGVLRDKLREKARGALLIGAAAPLIGEQLAGAIDVVQSGDIASAVSYAASHAARGDTVLLSPACASFDQFSSYEHRGQVFKQLVNSLPDGANAERTPAP